MIHKSKLVVSALPAECSVSISPTSKRFHGLSYYLNGGQDIDGDALDKSAEVEYDNEEQLKELEAEGACSVPYGDPRVSKFDLVEQYGKHEAKKVSSKSAKSTASDAGEATTTE